MCAGIEKIVLLIFYSKMKARAVRSWPHTHHMEKRLGVLGDTQGPTKISKYFSAHHGASKIVPKKNLNGQKPPKYVFKIVFGQKCDFLRCV